MKIMGHETLTHTFTKMIEDQTSKWSKIYNWLLKKKTAKIKQQKINLEQNLKILENNLTSEENRKLYSDYKNELETIYDPIADGIRIRSKCKWYEHGEKSTKFFLDLEKKQSLNKTSQKLMSKNNDSFIL